MEKICSKVLYSICSSLFLFLPTQLIKAGLPLDDVVQWKFGAQQNTSCH